MEAAAQGSVSAFEAVAGAAAAMVLIYLVTAFLPKIAAAIDRARGRTSEKKCSDIPDDKAEPSPERVDEDNKGNAPSDYRVHSLFEASELEDWDPNHKIYNEDIYSLDFLKKKGDGTDKKD